MNIVHLSTTPLAGSPYNISTALDTYTKHNSRHICVYPYAYNKRTFLSDLIWESDKELSMSVLKKADIVHCHHVFHTEHSPFGNLREICKKDTIFLRQFHSAPTGIPNHLLNIIDEDPLPSFVNAQHSERYFPKSRIVPNIVLIDKSDFKRTTPIIKHFISYSPSVKRSAWFSANPDQRWNTKGYPETVSLLKTLSNKLNFSFDIVYNVPWQECIERKSRTAVTIDEVVTGSYHLSSLEGLALGKPTLAFLDERTQNVLKQVTGANWLPWVNLYLDELEVFIEHFFCDEKLIQQIGERSKKWIKKYWHPKKMIKHYVDGYKLLINTGNTIEKNRFSDNPIDIWNIRTKSDNHFKTNYNRRKMKLNGANRK